MFKSISSNSLLIFVLLLVNSVNAQSIKKDSTNVETLEEVIVTATRTKRLISTLPLPAKVVLKKEIKDINSVRLSDILNEQTGLITVPEFGVEGIQLQGLDSQYILILIDGVPLIARTAGSLDLSRVTVGNIKKIEIIKGASSSLYGNEALGGVVNIITEDPKNGFNADIQFRSSSFNTQDLSSNINHKGDKLGVQFFVNRFSSSGYDLVSSDLINTVEPFYNYTFNTKLNYKFTENTNLTSSIRYYYQNQDNIQQNNDSEPTIFKGESKINEWNTLIKLEHQFNKKWKSYLEFYATEYNANEFLNDENGSLFSENEFKQRLIRPEFRSTYLLSDKTTFVGGIGLTNELLKRNDFFKNPEFNSPYIYLQYDSNITDQLNILLGARFDSHSEYSSQLSPKAAIRYKINDKISIKSSLGYGFKTPDFRQLYFDFTNATVGYTVLGYNAVTTRIPELDANGELISIEVPLSEFENNLKAESSVGFNFGIDYNPLSNVKLNLNIFRNDIKNLIDTRVIARKTSGQNVFSYYNINRVYTQGLELNSSYKINNNLTISGGYQLLYAKDKDVENAFKNGEVFARLTPNSPSFKLSKSDYFGLLNRSRHMANFKIFYDIPKIGLSTNIRGTYRSKYDNTSFNTYNINGNTVFDNNGNPYLDKYDDFINSYSIWDFAINKTILSDYKLGFGVDNVFDFKDPQNISNIAGRILYINTKINF